MEYSRQIRLWSVGIFLWALAVAPVRADVPENLPPLDRLSDDVETEIHELKGTFQDQKVWKGNFICRHSYWKYIVDAKADLATVDFELNGNGSIDVYADLYDLWGKAFGRYRSAKTLCVPLSKTITLGVDRAELFAEVRFTGTGESLKDIKVRVKGTRLGTIRLGKGVPSWIEKRITRWVNTGLAKLWASRLGGWISDKITDLIKDKIPVHRGGTGPDVLATWDAAAQEWSGSVRIAQ